MLATAPGQQNFTPFSPNQGTQASVANTCSGNRAAQLHIILVQPRHRDQQLEQQHQGCEILQRSCPNKAEADSSDTCSSNRAAKLQRVVDLKDILVQPRHRGKQLKHLQQHQGRNTSQVSNTSQHSFPTQAQRPTAFTSAAGPPEQHRRNRKHK